MANIIGSGNIQGTSNSDVITGSNGDDQIFGNGGDDLLAGLGGNDDLYGGLGRDDHYGGDGIDTVYFTHSSSFWVVNLAARTATADGLTETVDSIENVRVGSGGSQVTGDANGNFLGGGSGSDWLKGGGGNDQISGGAGSDTAAFSFDYSSYSIVRSGDDLLVTHANEGVDRVYSDVEFLQFSDGTRSITQIIADITAVVTKPVVSISGTPIVNEGGTLFFTVTRAGASTSLPLTVFYSTGGLAQNGIDYVTPFGSVTIAPGSSTAQISIATFNDGVDDPNDDESVIVTLVGSTNYIIGASATAGTIHDVNVSLIGGPGDDLLNGGSGDDLIDGGAGDDTLNGGAGNDTISGGFGVDTLDGGDGIDTVDYSYSSEDWNIQLHTATARSGSTTETIAHFENARGGSGDDRIVGTSGDNVLWGGAGNDSFFPHRGNDFVFSGSSDGDEISYLADNAATSGVTANLGTGLVTSAYYGTDTLLGYFRRFYGTQNDDQITASNGGFQRLLPSLGTDIIQGGSNFDILRYYDFRTSDSGFGVTFNVGAVVGSGTVVDAGGSIDTYSGIDYLSGSENNDTFNGGAVPATFQGLHGNNTYHGGPTGLDVVDYSFDHDGFGPSGAIDINLLTGTGTNSFGGTDTFVDVRNILGTIFADRFAGSNGNDVIDGKSDNDTAVFSYTFGSGYIAGGTADDLRIVGTEGDDRYLNIEFFEFAGGVTKSAAEVLGSDPPPPPGLFSPSDDIVNFNALSASNISALLSGSNPYLAFAGNDDITLPDAAHADQPLGAGATLYWDYSQTFFAGSGNDKIVIPDNFASSTQTINGGSQLADGKDVLFLPGKANDYDITVSLGTSWENTVTFLQPKSFPFDHVIKAIDVEKVNFRDPIFIFPNVDIDDRGLISEMLQLAIDSYSGTISRDWHPISAIELGIAPSNFEYAPFKYEFTDGHYSAKMPPITAVEPSMTHPSGVQIPGTEANAIVASGVIDGKRTLALAFRGTDSTNDIDDYFPFADHYAKFRPLIDALEKYVLDASIEEILVSGHSLGAAMVQSFLQENFSIPVKAITIASPGAEVTPPGNNLMNFVHDNDAVNAATILKTRVGSEIIIDSKYDLISAHFKENYHSSLIKLIDHAHDATNRFFYDDPLAEALRSESIYAGPNIRLNLGSNADETIFALRDDNYILSGGGKDTIYFADSNLFASGPRFVDGGSGDDALEINLGVSSWVYQPDKFVFTPDGAGFNLSYLEGGVGRAVASYDNIERISIGGNHFHADGTPFGRMIDGYIFGATVFADADSNNSLDPGEVSTTTNTDGSFNLVGGFGPIVAIGGTDIATRLPFKGHLVAPAGSTVITPLTTLIVALQADDIGDAHAQVLAAFGFDPATDLTTLDPITGTSGGDPQAALAYTTGIAVMNTLTLVTSTLAGGDPADYDGAYNAVLDAFADLIVTQGASLDLTDEQQIEGLIASALAGGGFALDPAAIDGVAAIVAALNAAVEAAGGATGVDLLAALSAIALVAQGAAADALKAVGDNPALLPDAVAAFTGDDLSALIDEAGGDTGDVDGPNIASAPHAIADEYGLDEDTTLTVNAAGVLGNDLDFDGDALAAALVTPAAHGLVILNPDGFFSYTPDADYHGTDSFTYAARDGALDSAETTVVLLIKALNDAPMLANALGDQDATEDSIFSFTIPANTFADVDLGDSLELIATLGDGLALPSWLTFNPATGELSGTPQNDDVGAITVRVTATDGSLASVYDDFTLSVANTDDAPTANLDTGSATENETKSFDVLANDTDPDLGDSKTLVSIGAVSVLSFNALVSGANAAGAFSIVGGQIQFSTGTLFDPLNTGEVANVVVNYTMRDAAGLISASALALTINGTTDGPVYNVINGTTGNDRSLSGTATADQISGLAGNDAIDAKGGDDLITAGTGSDQVYAGSGNDTIMASINDGNDIYVGDAGLDTMDFSQIGTPVTVNLGTTIFEFTAEGIGSARGTQIGTDILLSIENAVGGSGNDTISGNGLANVLDGRAGNDTISGGDGADILKGGVGNDFMNGGAGSDTFVFAPGFGNDRIQGFDANPAGGQDYLDVTAFGISATDFATRVTITDTGADTLVAVDGIDTIRLVGIGNAASVTVNDFLVV